MIPIPWRLGVAAACVAALVGLWVYVVHLMRETAQARSQAVAAQTQMHVDQAALPVIERFHETQVRIVTQAERSAQDATRLPTAETVLDDSFRAGLVRLLDPGPAAADPDRPSEPKGPLRPAIP